MRTIGELGEQHLIERIGARISGPVTREVLLGIGDDAALLRPRSGEDLVISTDACVEGVHFRWQDQSPAAIGRRALIANLSDLAAMGARPVACTLALCAPPTLELRRFDGFVRGFAREAKEYGCPLVGGNLSRSGQTAATVTVLGAVRRGRALRRCAARDGDRIFVTGSLGGAALALARCHERGAPIRHLPVARIDAGLALARRRDVGACIDLSDGLASDLGQILRASGVGAEIDVSRVPRPRGFAAACERLGLDPDPLCLAGGEDYELLFSLRAPRVRSARPVGSAELGRRLGVVVTEIGRISRHPGLRGMPHIDTAKGWRHF